MTCRMAEDSSIRKATKLAVAISVAAVTLLMAAGPSSAARIRCAAQDPCAGTKKGDRMIGTRGSDVILGRRGTDALYGRKGNDDLRGGHGEDTVRGGPGHDVVDVGAYRGIRNPSGFPEILSGGPGHDVMYGNDGFNSFTGGGGNDTMYGGGGRDEYWFMSADRGHDVIVDLPDPDDNLLRLTSFYDDLVIDLNSSGDHHEMRTADGTATVDWDDDGINFILGGYGDDIIYGNEHDNVVFAQRNDTIYGGEGNDDLWAVDWDGDVTIYGGGGDDVIHVMDAIEPHEPGSDTVDCGPGDADTVHFDDNDNVVNCEILNP